MGGDPALAQGGILNSGGEAKGKVKGATQMEGRRLGIPGSGRDRDEEGQQVVFNGCEGGLYGMEVQRRSTESHHGILKREFERAMVKMT